MAANGWLYSETDVGYDRAWALYPEDIFAWLEDTRPDELKKVASQVQVLDRIGKVLDGPLDSTGGTLNLLRRGFQTGAANFHDGAGKGGDGTTRRQHCSGAPEAHERLGRDRSSKASTPFRPTSSWRVAHCPHRSQ